jgi:hypothetical protein
MNISDTAGKRQYMIQVGRVTRAALPVVAERLRACGVVLDESYGFIPLDSTFETFLTRGVIDKNNIQHLESDPDVHIYPDVGVGTMA